MTPTTSVKQLNRDWKRLADLYAMSQWYEVSSMEQACKVVCSKWLKSDPDDSDSEGENINQNDALEKLQNIRHVSVIIPQIFEDLDDINDKYQGPAKYEVEPAILKKDLQQVIKVCSILNIFLHNKINLIIVQESQFIGYLVNILITMRDCIGNEVIKGHVSK